MTASQAPLFMGFSRQEYWSGLPCPPPGHLPDPETEPGSLRFPALAGKFFASSVSWEAQRKPLCPKKGPTCYSEDTAQHSLPTSPQIFSPKQGLLKVNLQRSIRSQSLRSNLRSRPWFLCSPYSKCKYVCAIFKIYSKTVPLSTVSKLLP